MGPSSKHNSRIQREWRGREWYLYAVHDRGDRDRFSFWQLVKVGDTFLVNVIAAAVCMQLT